MKRFRLRGHKARFPMGRVEIKIVATLILVVAAIFALSVVLVRDVLLWATTLARGQSQELVAELGRAAEFYRTLVETEKRLFVELSRRYGAQVEHELEPTMSPEGRATRIRETLDLILKQDNSLGRIRLVDPFGKVRVDLGKPQASDLKIWRHVVVKRRLKRAEPKTAAGLERKGPELHLTFLVPRRLEEMYERIGQLERDNPHLNRLDLAGQPHYYRTFLKWFVVAILAVTILGLFLARRITRRVTNLSRATSRVAEGDLEVTVPVQTKDELGQLAQAFNQMVRQIRRSRAQIAYLQKISAWQDIARRLAHEIKNPLTPIQLAMQQVHETYRGDDEKFRKTLEEASEIIREEVQTLRQMVEEFSAFAKLPQVTPEPESVNTLVDEFLRSLPGLDDPQTLSWKPVDPDLRVMVDRMLFRRVLHNLVDNAIHACSASGQKPRVEIRAHPLGAHGQIEFTVEDNGPGIPEELGERIFDPYITTKQEGTGLGLAIVKKILLEHKGSIEVQKGSEGGARFVIRIPRA